MKNKKSYMDSECRSVESKYLMKCDECASWVRCFTNENEDARCSKRTSHGIEKIRSDSCYMRLHMVYE